MCCALMLANSARCYSEKPVKTAQKRPVEITALLVRHDRRPGDLVHGSGADIVIAGEWPNTIAFGRTPAAGGNPD